MFLAPKIDYGVLYISQDFDALLQEFQVTSPVLFLSLFFLCVTLYPRTSIISTLISHFHPKNEVKKKLHELYTFQNSGAKFWHHKSVLIMKLTWHPSP